MKYIVENTETNEVSYHRTWEAAYRVAGKYPETANVIIIERDRDGQRTYDSAGNILDREYRE
jgi:hypothetical protein